MTANQEGCLVCGGHTSPFADGFVLRERRARYVRCDHCGLVRVEAPDWLDEAYTDAIAALDVGLLSRSLEMSHILSAVLRTERLASGTFLDWAGGYGTLTRLMRDRGYDFFHHDPFCSNLFAVGLDGELDGRYDLVSAIEVLEHLVDPVADLDAIASCTDRLLVTTLLLPDPAPKPGDWWYFTPETGQHITFFTRSALHRLSARLRMQCLSLNDNIHLFHRVRPTRATRLLLRRPRLACWLGAVSACRNERSLLPPDIEAARARTQDDTYRGGTSRS